MSVISYYSIAKDFIKAILSVSGLNLKTNQKIVKLLKKYNFAHLQKDFQSIYVFSLIEYGENCKPKELINLFGNEDVIDAFKNQLYMIGPTGQFPTALDHILHTCKDKFFLKLKKEFRSSRLEEEIEIFIKIFKQQTHNSKDPLDIETHEKLNEVIDGIK